jgi:formylmethanofuran dehydrogenase subunit E
MEHTHKYERENIARDGKPAYWVMRCILPGCNSYTPMKTKLSCPMLKGKIALCNKCEEKFELTRRALRFAKPICVDCVKSPKKKMIKSAEDFFNQLEMEIKP